MTAPTENNGHRMCFTIAQGWHCTACGGKFMPDAMQRQDLPRCWAADKPAPTNQPTEGAARREWERMTAGFREPRKFDGRLGGNRVLVETADAALAEATAGELEAVRERDRLEKENKALRDALTEIACGSGPFSRDPLTHAANTIEHMVNTANEALSRIMEAPDA